MLPYLLKDLSDNCSWFIAKCNLMQCKHIISLIQQFVISKIGLCWHQRSHISLSKYTRNYKNSIIIRDNEIKIYNTIVIDEDNEYMYDEDDDATNEQYYNDEKSSTDFLWRLYNIYFFHGNTY